MSGDGGFMDLMEIRRNMMGVIAQMAKGANFIKGTFTAPSGASSYTLNFGKTFNKYIYLVEMTEESKTALVNSGITAIRAFAWVGIWPNVSINNVAYASNSLYARYNPSTNETSGGVMSASSYSNSSITFAVSNLTSITTLFEGYSYNYYIVEVD